MDGWRWITVFYGILVLNAVSAGAADDRPGTASIESPRLLVPAPPELPLPGNVKPADPAEPDWDDVSGPLVEPPTASPEFPAPPELPPPTEHWDATRAVPDITFEDESNWLNRVVDEHLLIWRELPGSLEFIPGDGDSFGVTTLGFEASIKSDSSPGVWVVPKFGWHFLSGPRLPHLPPQLYTLTLEVNFAIDLNSDTRLHLHIAPMWATDFDANSGESFRMIGGGLLAHDLSPEWMLAVGAIYLDRPDLPALPLGGVRWKPADHIELDLMFPRPRAAWRFNVEESGDDAGEERWFYVGGGLGGDSWAFDRVGGPDDRVGYRDLRVLVGAETRETDGTRRVLEFGYVFDRQLDFDRGPGDQNLPGTALVRIGATY